MIRERGTFFYRPEAEHMVVSLVMGWRQLLFENWPIDPALVDSHLPESLTVDRHDGNAWLSVVPFTNVAVRPKGLPRKLGVRLPEINVRTYVTYDGVPSVYFFSLDAQGLASVMSARLFHHLPYYYARISLSITDGRVRFDSQRCHPGARPGRYEATYWPTGEPFDAPRIRSRNSSSSAIDSIPKLSMDRFATLTCVTILGRCTPPKRLLRPTHCYVLLVSPNPTRSRYTTTALD